MMKITNKIFRGLIIVSLATTSLISCQSNNDDSDSGSTVQTEVADSIGVVAKGVSAIGAGIDGNTVLGKVGAFAVTQFAQSWCDEHGQPLSSANSGTQMNQSAEMYPYLHTYCAVSISDGDTVRGGFELAQSLVCVLEKGGIQFAGQAQTITGDFADTDCWPDGGPGGSTGTFSMTATGTTPAAFNTHYEKGVVFTVDSFGLTFKIAANLDGDKIEFITHESWSGSNAGSSAGNEGTMAGELVKSTGVLRFEKRDYRVRSDCSTSNCGWNRHTRIYAVLNMTNGEPSGLSSLSYGYSDLQIDASTLSSGGTNGSAKIVTASGTLSSSIKARLFTTSGKNLSQLNTTGQYSETANTACASSAGFDDGADCSGNSGIALFSTDTKFTLHPSSSATSAASWHTTFSGFNFTSVSLDTDNAF